MNTHATYLHCPGTDTTQYTRDTARRGVLASARSRTRDRALSTLHRLGLSVNLCIAVGRAHVLWPRAMRGGRASLALLSRAHRTDAFSAHAGPTPYDATGKPRLQLRGQGPTQRPWGALVSRPGWRACSAWCCAPEGHFRIARAGSAPVRMVQRARIFLFLGTFA